jgi:exopolysaccharide biosynthesis protein
MQPDRFSRRTVIGQDTTGRIIIMATPFLGLTLLDLSAYLPTTDLNLVNAFNLDGGRSTLMYIRSPEYILNSVDAVPAVLAIYPR